MKWVNIVANVLVWVGALNWGAMGLLKTNVVESLLGVGTLTTVVYDLVGLSALWVLYTAFTAKGGLFSGK